MASPGPISPAGGAPQGLSAEEGRWLHDKFERLSAEEVQLAGSRTSYFAAIGTILISATIVATADLLAQPLLLAAVVSFLAGLGLIVSFVWVVLLHRTNDAQTMWREAALHLEQFAPPIAGDLPAPVTLRSGRTLTVNLLHPYQAHQARFDPANHISWLDRVNPERLTESLPLTFLCVWTGTLVAVWAWYFVLR